VDEQNNFVGIVFLDQIREIIFQPEMYDKTFVSELMFTPEVTLDPEESMEEVAQKFQKSSKFNLVVIKDGKYLGFISRARVFSSYRNLLKQFSDD